MAAIYYKFKNNDLFIGNQPVSIGVNIPDLEIETAAEKLIMYTRIGCRLTETIQYFSSFDDVISHMHFGKGLGGLSIEGVCFASCESNEIEGVKEITGWLEKKRGKTITVGFLGGVLEAIIQNISFDVTNADTTSVMFSFDLGVIDASTFQPQLKFEGSC